MFRFSFFFDIKFDSDTLVFNWSCNLHSMRPKNKTDKDDKGSKEAIEDVVKETQQTNEQNTSEKSKKRSKAKKHDRRWFFQWTVHSIETMLGMKSQKHFLRSLDRVVHFDIASIPVHQKKHSEVWSVQTAAQCAACVLCDDMDFWRLCFNLLICRQKQNM